MAQLEKRVEKRHLISAPVLCFLLTFIAFNLVFMTRGVSLFGGKSILISDMKQQYIDFFAALRAGDVFYSDGIGLSGDFSGSFAYYLSSPLSLIIFLFKPSQLQSALLLLLYLKASLASSSFCRLLRRFRHTALASVCFSLCYSLMSFLFYFFINIFWLDALILLPPLAASVIKLADTGRSRSLPGLLALLFAANFYIAYITGVFLLLFFIFLAAARSLPLRETFRRGVRLAGAALFGAAISAVVLLPAARSYLKTAGHEAFNGYGSFNFTAKQLLLKLFNGHYDSIGNYAAPTVFAGTLVLILLACYFSNKSVSVREKLASGGLLLLMMLSFWLPALDSVWHGFSYPNAFAYRYAFCFCFFAILLAARAFRLRSFVPTPFLLVCTLPAALIAAFARSLTAAGLSAVSVAATAAGFALFPALLFIEKIAAEKSPASAAAARVLVAALLSAELLLNACGILAGIDAGYTFPAYSEWITKYETKRSLLLEAGYRGLSRVADTDRESYNSGAALRYKGVSSFSSDYNPALQRIFAAVGYDGGYKQCGYLPGTPAADSLFGIEFIFSDRALPGYSLLSESGGIFLHQNVDALTAAAAVPDSMRDFSFDGTDPEADLAKLLTAMLPEDKPPAGEQNAESALAALSKHSLAVTEWGHRKISGNISAASDGLLFTTMPYDSNYTVRLDGKKTGTFKLLGGLLAAELTAGEHRVEITYFPKEAAAGAAISCLALAAWLGSFRFPRKSAHLTGPSWPDVP